MANVIREALNADQMALPIFCGGMSKVGVNLAGTWVGTVKFYASVDGLNFNLVSVTPFASGTTVQSSVANGSWEFLAQNYVAFKVVFTRTSGTVIVTLATSIDSSYQDAFLASTSIYVRQEVTGGATNVITQTAQANRAWRLRSLSVAFSVAASAAVKLTISDGASSVLWNGYVPLGAGQASGGGTYEVPLPPDPNTPGLVGGGLVNTPGNTMVITLAAPGGSVVSEVNAELHAA